MAKKVMAVVKLQCNAGKATPAPPVGPALGQYGINIMEFVKGYNERTKDQVGTVIPVEITVFEDRTFTFITKTQLRQIATTKMGDMNALDVEGAEKIIAGTARSMGIKIVD